MKHFAALFRCLDETTKTSGKLRLPAATTFAPQIPKTLPGPCTFLRDASRSAWCRSGDSATVVCRGSKDSAVAIRRVPRHGGRSGRDDCADCSMIRRPRATFPCTPASSSSSPWRHKPPAEQRDLVVAAWRRMNRTERLVWNKLLTSEFRVGISQTLVVRALAENAQLPPAAVAHRLMGSWEPSADFFSRLLQRDTEDADLSRPYPFCLAHPLQVPSGDPGRCRRLAGRVEMGWHPRTTNPTPGTGLSVDARRRAGYRTISRAAACRGSTSRRNGHRWRNRGLEGRCW